MGNKRMYIIAGCNGAGKTTASFNILPLSLNCLEYVNADEIARGISPFQPEKAALEAGRIMLRRIGELLGNGYDFAFETTLASKSFHTTIRRAQAKGYFITLIYYWLESKELAIQRVKIRVSEGGHHIPVETIRRRYDTGLNNLFKIYFDLVDALLLFDNSKAENTLILELDRGFKQTLYKKRLFNKMKTLAHGKNRRPGNH